MDGLGLFTARPWPAGAEVLRVEEPDYFAPARSHAQLRAMGYTHADIFQVGPDLLHPAARRPG